MPNVRRTKRPITMTGSLNTCDSPNPEYGYEEQTSLVDCFAVAIAAVLKRGLCCGYDTARTLRKLPVRVKTTDLRLLVGRHGQG